MPDLGTCDNQLGCDNDAKNLYRVDGEIYGVCGSCAITSLPTRAEWVDPEGPF